MNKKTLPFFAKSAVVALCCIFNIFLLFGGDTKLLSLFRTPIPIDFFGGKITYAVFYGVFFAASILFSFFQPKLVSIPATALILFEGMMLFLPAYYYAEQLSGKQAEYYLASLFSDRLFLTLKSISVILFGLLLLIEAFSKKKIRIFLSGAGVVLAVLTVAAESIYMLNPAVNSETLSFWTKFPFSIIFDLFRFIPLALLPFLFAFEPDKTKKAG